MKKIFELCYKGNLDVTAVEVMKKNVQELENLCKKAIKEDFEVVLYSPEKYDEPKNTYELSVMLAEDMVLKYSDKNCIVRVLISEPNE